jgi:FKBP-type peptidyl-prolyl cis-trans isomerase
MPSVYDLWVQRGIIPLSGETPMWRVAAVLAVFLMALPGLAPAAHAADDALSIEANQAFLAANAKKPGVIVRPDGLQFKILQNGFGKRPYLTDTVKLYYTGSLINGSVFDGTSPGLPASFKVDSVITGWIEALSLMREGDHWQIVIPPKLGYGDQSKGNGLIPPNQVLIFDIRLVSTTPAPKPGDKDYIPDPNDPDANRQ